MFFRLTGIPLIETRFIFSRTHPLKRCLAIGYTGAMLFRALTCFFLAALLLTTAACAPARAENNQESPWQNPSPIGTRSLLFTLFGTGNKPQADDEANPQVEQPQIKPLPKKLEPAPISLPQNPLPQPSAEPPPPPYAKDLLRLAEILGTLSYFTALCPPDATTTAKPSGDYALEYAQEYAQKYAQEYAHEMEQLIATEGTSEQRRNRLIGAYNQGMRAYALTHFRCTEAAKLIIAAHLQEGSAIAARINKRYGGL